MNKQQQAPSTDATVKHRILAGLKLLEQETVFLEKQVEELERMDNASAACREYPGIDVIPTQN